ncbi:MAG: AAA family ATPase [Candidatus Acidiferrales bacterium]
MWTIEQLEINGGFLPGLKLALPRGLTCIIGPRGSGKSTLAEALRFAMKGATGASKSRLDLLQANLGGSGSVSLLGKTAAGITYTIKRAYRQPAVLLSSDGRAVPDVNLDRGTFLPLDAYSGLEIENIADEVLGDKRRALLDELRGDDLSRIQLSLSEHKRALQANADRIKATQRATKDLSERIEELGDVRARLTALGPAPETGSSLEYSRASKQQQSNSRELRKIDNVLEVLGSLCQEVEGLKARIGDRKVFLIAEEGSANAEVLEREEGELGELLINSEEKGDLFLASLEAAAERARQARSKLLPLHAEQSARFSELRQQRETDDEQYRVRAELEQRIAKLQEMETEQSAKKQELAELLDGRKSLKASFLLEREQVSSLRDSVARELQRETGAKIRIGVRRNADDLAYRTTLIEGLRGARVRNHDEILESLLQLRPEQLAQLIQADDASGLDDACGFGPDRATKIMDAFRANVDPLELEVVDIEDQVRIELNVATSAEPLFKDASELSRGQKCTALLPLLLARRDSPLIIDQPEDNLDNHFIYETVVDAVKRLKRQRQMIFITHNANIPVLADADLVIVLNSDGRIGYIEKFGSVDDCRDEIIDLLEGGKQAFELRRKRYAGS